MKEYYVTYEQAQALKRLGFDWEVTDFYLLDENKEPRLCREPIIGGGKDNYNGYVVETSAPRLDQAQAWLREVKEIDVLVFNCACGYGWEISKAVKDLTRGTRLKRYDYEGEHEDSGMWLSYEEALSAGIDKALELLGTEVDNEV